MRKTLVVTTINSPTEALQESVRVATEANCETVVVGDAKTPANFVMADVEFLPIKEQNRLGFRISESLPTGTYSRKMIGYLRALKRGAELIYETDDDNSLYRNFFDEALMSSPVRTVGEPGFVNHYRFFTSEMIWPRGLPLDEFINNNRSAPREREAVFGSSSLSAEPFGVVQGLADGNPDVDAVFRLTQAQFDYSNFHFSKAEPLAVSAASRSWLPLNSQVTIWPRDSAALLYLPVTCSFRMTDIWRGYVAQRVFHELDISLMLVGPMAFQDRNDHNLMSDFADEVEGYLGYRRFVQVLESAELSDLSVGEQLKTLYRRLVDARFFQEIELQYLDDWIHDVQAV